MRVQVPLSALRTNDPLLHDRSYKEVSILDAGHVKSIVEGSTE